MNSKSKKKSMAEPIQKDEKEKSIFDSKLNESISSRGFERRESELDGEIDQNSSMEKKSARKELIEIIPEIENLEASYLEMLNKIYT
jgi:hypothetical protein